MAALKTIVSSPRGTVAVFAGRLSREQASSAARKVLETRIEKAQADLDQHKEWEVAAYRGSTRAKTADEL